MTQSPSLNCWCTTCRPPDPADPSSMRLALCPSCGNKRCPRAHNHTLACTNSNAPGQPGSSWEHVRPIHETAACAPRLAGEQTAADRELLELAAKTIGRKVTGWNTAQGELVAVLDDGSFWQPLSKNRITDSDGDALRLAVKLNIAVWFVSYPHGLTGFPGGDFVKAVGVSVVHIPLDAGDNAAATRRAIAQAAAAIGRAMP